MNTLGTTASLIRSKNAGPFELTLDVMFPDRESYQRVVRSNCLDPSSLSELLGVAPEHITIFPYPAALAIKITVPRQVSVGDPSERDLFGGQIFSPIVDLIVEPEEKA